MSGFSKGYICLFIAYIRNSRGILQRKFIVPIIEASKSVGYRRNIFVFLQSGHFGYVLLIFWDADLRSRLGELIYKFRDSMRTIDWLSYLKKYMLTFQSKMRLRTLETSLGQKNQRHWVYLIDPWRYVLISPKFRLRSWDPFHPVSKEQRLFLLLQEGRRRQPLLSPADKQMKSNFLHSSPVI